MIKLNDDIGIKRIKSFHDQLIKEIDRQEEVVIDFSKVNRVDLSVLQVIIAAGRAAGEKGKTIKLKQVCSEVKAQMHLCGLKT